MYNLNPQDIQMLWCAVEEQLFKFSEGATVDPRFNIRDWRILFEKIEARLENRRPKPFERLRKK